MKGLLLSASIFICSVVLAQPGINKTNSRGEKHGPWKEFYPNSKVPKYEGMYVNGQPKGKFKYYYEDKTLKAEMIFDDKNPNISRCTMYDVDGKKNAFGKYVNKQKDSVWTYYSPPGFVSYRETYDHGVLHGLKTIYYPPADYKPGSKQQITQQYKYVKGVLSGEVKEYYADGVLKMEGVYDKNNLHGEVKKYHPNGKISFLERYKHGRKHGWWYGYNMAGKELGKRFYQNGQEYTGEAMKKKLAELKAAGINPNDCGK